MADKVKEIYKGTITLEQANTAPNGVIDLIETDGTKQFVIKDVQVKGSLFNRSATLQNNGFVECALTSSTSGSAIVDINSVVSFNYDKDPIDVKEVSYILTNTGIPDAPTKVVKTKFTCNEHLSDFVVLDTQETNVLYNSSTVHSVADKVVMRGSNSFISDDVAGYNNTTTYTRIGSITTSSQTGINILDTSAFSCLAYSEHKDSLYYRNNGMTNTIYKLDIENMPYVGDSHNLNSRRMVFSSDGLKVFFLNDTSGSVVVNNLSIPYDFRSITSKQFFDINNLGGCSAITSYAMQFSFDGTKLYVKSGDNKIYQISLTNPFDLSSGSLEKISTVAFSNQVDFYMHFDGTFIITKDTTATALKKYPLSTPFDITTVGSVSQTYTVSGMTGDSQIAVSKSGNYIIVGTATQYAKKITLTNGNFSLASCTVTDMPPGYSTAGSIVFNTGYTAIALTGNDERLCVIGNAYSPVSYKIDIATITSDPIPSIVNKCRTLITLNNNTITPLLSTTQYQRLVANGKYLFFKQNGSDVYVIDTDTNNVGLLTSVGLASTMDNTTVFAVYYDKTTDVYCLSTILNGSIVVRYVPAETISLVCENRNSYSCTQLEIVSNTTLTSATTGAVFGIKKFHSLFSKYYFMFTDDSVGTAYRTSIDLWDIRTSKKTEFKAFGLGNIVGATTNLSLISPSLPLEVNSEAYNAFNKNLDIRISGVEITEEN